MAVLAAMVLIARPSDLTHIAVDSLQVHNGGQEMTVNLLAFKNDYHRDGASLTISACSEPKLCFIRACSALLGRLRSRYQRPSALTSSRDVTFALAVLPAALQVASRWISSCTSAVGVTLQRFTVTTFVRNDLLASRTCYSDFARVTLWMLRKTAVVPTAKFCSASQIYKEPTT